jgi:Flavin containing amine oxidoreductase
MFGLLNKNELDSMNQKDYSRDRGRFYFFWNVTKTAGQPVLIALMAGDAARSVEETDNETLVQEATARLSKVFAPKHVPRPVEVIITRWGKDRFARGTYSYVGSQTLPGDYDIMAQPHGPIHFAGEATNGTHPATVHGAYLSGLRAAAEVVESILGPIQINESPLVPPKVKHEITPPKPTLKPRYEHIWEPINKPDMFTPVILEPKKDFLETEIQSTIETAIGEKPQEPTKAKLNPFIIYVSSNWERCRIDMEAKLDTPRGPDGKISRHDIRAALGLEWRTAPDLIKQPYLDKCKNGREVATEAMNEYNKVLATWEDKAKKIREEYLQDKAGIGQASNGTAEQRKVDAEMGPS